MNLEIRTAKADDKGPIAELIYSSGMDIYDYLYGHRALEFLKHEFDSGIGFAGHPHVTVAVLNGEVVGTGCFFDRSRFGALRRGSARNMVSFFGVVGVMPHLWRSRHVSSVMRRPQAGEIYLSNLGVASHLRGKGIGSKIIRHKIKEAQGQGNTTFGLDVSTGNPRGEALYIRLGLRVTEQKAFSANHASVLPIQKMELSLFS